MSARGVAVGDYFAQPAIVMATDDRHDSVDTKERARRAEDDGRAAREARGIGASIPSDDTVREAIAGMDLRPDLPSIPAPTLAIAGADDPATPPPHLRLIADSVQDGRCLVVPQSAHLANDEQPGTITPAILEHLGLH